MAFTISALGINVVADDTSSRECNPAKTAPKECALQLGLGDEIFWDGGYMGTVNATGWAGDFGPTGCEANRTCFEFRLKVKDTSTLARLRVAVHTFMRDPGAGRAVADSAVDASFALRLIDPDGKTRDTKGDFGIYAVETLAGGPKGPPVQVGTWKVQFFPEGEVDMWFRMRAKLEVEAPQLPGTQLPDLRIIPPYEIGFGLPTVSMGPVVPGYYGPVPTCSGGELVEAFSNGTAPTTSCLRFSMGIANAGAGRLRLTPRRSDELSMIAGHAAGHDIPLVQYTCDQQGFNCTEQPRPDGLVAQFHSTHAHFHYQNAYVFALYAVVDDKNGPHSLKAVADARKLGFQPMNEAMEGWTEFYQLPRSAMGGERDSSGCLDAAFCEMFLQAGWGDVYEWNRDGNYVAFPLGADLRPKEGTYVLVGMADPGRQIVESDDSNNDAYALFRVSSSGEVQLLERGHGAGPWDPHREPVNWSP